MEKKLVSYCPRCKHKLTATRLTCKECDIELTGDFNLSKFDHLTDEEHDFIISFLKLHGNLKSLQSKKNISYTAVKKNLEDILIKLGVQDDSDVNKERSIKTFIPIDKTDSLVIKMIKEKLNDNRGIAIIKLFRGEPCEIRYDSNNTGLISSKIPISNQLIWEVFDAAVEVVISNGGKAIKGKARSGAKLGTDDLPLDSVEGYIAYKVHGVEKGGTAFGPGFVICAVLDWAGICNNERGYLSLNSNFWTEYKKTVELL